ncbi:MAG TPA: hypothetical protein VG737_06050 [Cyclobacteriaceae bacterium]|nr:hypothetical protein [Cyclobacteriaceae bacterium]
MFEPLFKIVEQNAQKSIIQNSAVPDQLNNAAIKEVTTQIFTGLKGQVSEGNMQQVISMFQIGSKGMTSHPVVGSIIASVAESLVAKFGIQSAVAQSIATGMVPAVMTEVIRKANDPRDIEFDLQQMMRSMTGNSALDISSMMPQPQRGAIGKMGDMFGKLFGK